MFTVYIKNQNPLKMYIYIYECNSQFIYNNQVQTM